MNLKDLDYASIVAMYEKNGKKGIADSFVYQALENYSDDKISSDYDFLENRTIPMEILQSYKDNGKVLCLLARKKVESKEFIWRLIYNVCSYYTIKELVKEGIMPKKYLEDRVIKSKEYSFYLDIFSDNGLQDIDYNILLFCFMGLDQDIKNTDYLDCIKVILKRIPYSEEFHLPLAKLLCCNEYANVSRINDIIKYFLNNSENFENLLQIRSDILYLFRYLRSGKVNIKDIDGFLGMYKYHSNSAIEDIKVVKRKDIAWCLELYEFNESTRISILNYWARNNQIEAFDTYYKYFTSDNLDYENVGKALDEKFKNTMDESMVRVRVK